MADITKIKVNGTTYNIKDASAVETVTVNNVTLLPLNNDINIGTVVTSESDPTVPSWAKASTKPTYTASEVGAQETLVSGTNIKTINNNSILGSGNLEVGGGGTVVYDGDSTTDTPYDNLFMETVVSGVTNVLLNTFYPVGSIYMSVNNTNPSTLFGGTWELISSVALASEHVFGNEYNLAITDNTGNSALTLTTVYQSNKAFSYRHGSYGVKIPLANGTSGSGTFGTGGGLGLPTKAQHNGHPEYSGIIADTITVYSWKRTA